MLRTQLAVSVRDFLRFLATSNKMDPNNVTGFGIDGLSIGLNRRNM